MSAGAAVQFAIVDDWSAGYADGRADAAAGMLAYLVPEFHGVEYAAGYEAGAAGA